MVCDSIVSQIATILKSRLSHVDVFHFVYEVSVFPQNIFYTGKVCSLFTCLDDKSDIVHSFLRIVIIFESLERLEANVEILNRIKQF